MRSLLATAIALLAGCSVVPPQAWTYDGTHPTTRTTADAGRVAMLTDRIARLQLQRDELMGRIAAERDVWQRQALYADLHAVGRELSPLQRELSTYASAR